MQNVVIEKNLPVKGLCGRCLSGWGPEPHNPPTHAHTVYVYTVYVLIYTNTRKWGMWDQTREKVRGATVHKTGSKIPTIYQLYLQSINSDKHWPKMFLLQVNFFRRRHFALMSIYLTSPWSPRIKFAGTLSSETRPGSVLFHRLPSLRRSSLRGEESPGSWSLPRFSPSL